MATAGAEWTRNDVKIVIREIPNQAFPLIERATTEHLETDENNVGAFGEVWWRTRPTVALYGSLRFDYVELPVRDLLDPSGSGRNTFAQWSGGIGVSKRLDQAWNVFTSYGRGFRATFESDAVLSAPFLDTDYHSFGVLFENVRGPAVGVEPFLTPGHPRRLTAGMRIRLPG